MPGRTAYVKSNSSNPIKNNGGSMLMVGGNVASTSPITRTVTSVSNPRRGSGSDMQSLSASAYNGNNGGIYIVKALATGELGKQRAGQFVALKLSVFLAGVSNTVLQLNGAIKSKPANSSIHYALKAVTVKAVTTGWSRSTGAYLSAPPVQTDLFGGQSAGVAPTGRDDAIPTSAIPGEFVFRDGSSLAIYKKYAPKTD